MLFDKLDWLLLFIVLLVSAAITFALKDTVLNRYIIVIILLMSFAIGLTRRYIFLKDRK